MIALDQDSRLKAARTSLLSGKTRRRVAAFLHPRGTLYVLIASAPAIIACLIASFRWPLVHDAPLMHYIAWRILSGAVPYRDLFDMNMPGVYVLHILVLKIFGPSDLGWRLFDLVWLLFTAGAIYLLCRPVSRWGGLLGAVFFFCYHLSVGAINMGQRDFLLCVFLLLSAHFSALSVERRASPKWALLGGLCLGAGVTIKPYCALYGIFIITLIVLRAYFDGSPWVREVLSFAAGSVVAPFLLGIWLVRTGGLGPMLDITFKFLAPFYSKMGNGDTLTLALLPLRLNQLWIFVTLLAWRRIAKSLRYWLMVLGTAFGWFSFVLQGKGWDYHLYPFNVFLCALLGVSLASLLQRRALATKVLGFSCLSLFMLLIALRCWSVSQTPMSSDLMANKVTTVKCLAAYLRPRIDPSRDTVQIMDEAEGGIHALFLLRAAEPTRFIYDYQFLPDFQSQYAQALRTEFEEGLRTRPPKYIVVFNRPLQGPSGHDRVKLEFPDLNRLLTQSYNLEFSSFAYDVYARRER